MKSAAAHTIRLAGGSHSFLCGAEQSILKAMVSLGRRGIPSGCHGGGCGVCKVRIIEGVVRTVSMSRGHVSETEEAKGYALACRAYPLSDVELEVVGEMRKGLVRHYGLF